MSLASALTKARVTQMNALHDAYGASVIIDGTPFACAAEIGRVQPEQLDDMTWRDVQVNVFRVRKALLATAPTARTKILFDSREFFVTRIGGQRSDELAWVITAKRILSKQVS